MKLNRTRMTAILLAAIACASLALSACSPRLVGEDKAKEAGLAFINKVFDVNEIKATVEYEERAGFTYVNGCSVHYGTEEPIRVYVIKVNPDEIGNFDYYAEVNAVTGEAYRADKAWELLKSMTAEQQTRADELYSQEIEWSKVLQSVAQQETTPEAEKWFKDVFHPDAPILSTIFFLSEGDSFLRNGIDVEDYIVLLDGTMYSLDMVWPTFEVLSITRVS